MTFREALAQQRWDDHRYYHHNRVNQSLHFLSACSFVIAHALVFVAPALAVMIGWLIAMPSRQIGHFFFEPRDYDVANQATHEHKEAIKVGYNLRRKAFLMSAWAVAPLIAIVDPTFFAVLEPHTDWLGFVDNVAVAWLALGVAALVGRTVQLCFLRDVQTGAVWCANMLTDPFHDLKRSIPASMHSL
jgi:hypothetical protein